VLSWLERIRLSMRSSLTDIRRFIRGPRVIGLPALSSVPDFDRCAPLLPVLLSMQSPDRDRCTPLLLALPSAPDRWYPLPD
jgi:hypothetical protein